MEPYTNENTLPTHKCKPGHCLCNAIDTLADPPEVGRRIQAYSYVDGWEFITWHNGDQNYFNYWRPDMDPHPCQTVTGDCWERHNKQQRQAMDWNQYNEMDLPNISSITWRPVDRKCTYLPDPKKEILIYDGYLKKVVTGIARCPKDFELGDNPRDILWFNQVTGGVLTDPRWWTDVPFPEGEKTCG